MNVQRFKDEDIEFWDGMPDKERLVMKRRMQSKYINYKVLYDANGVGCSVKKTTSAFHYIEVDPSKTIRIHRNELFWHGESEGYFSPEGLLFYHGVKVGEIDDVQIQRIARSKKRLDAIFDQEAS